jgi:tetratricopeptide (TPR) repeat protein/DNA-binding XRE family transcriptional regulator
MMDHGDIQAFGEALAHFRTRAGISQQRLADQLGVSRRSVAAWEAGEYLPKAKGVVLQIARLLNLTEEETTTLLRTSGMDPLPAIWHVPYAQNPLFTGREETLHHLELLLLPESEAASTLPQALCGLGGIGKTLTALEYAYRHRHAYAAVFWLQADSWDILSSEVMKLAHALHLPERDDQDQARVIEAVRRWLKGHQHWLLILDDIEDLQVLQTFLPPGHSGHVLLTTRAQVAGPLIQAHQIHAMNEQEGVRFLLQRTGHLPREAPLEQVPGSQYRDARQIWQHMEGLPLALDQAGAYILETGCTLSDYLALYQSQRASLLRSRGNLFPLEHPLSVTSTFLLSFQKIEQQNPVAAEVLRAGAFLYAEAIPEEVILGGTAHLGTLLASLSGDLHAWNRVLAVLRAYSLVRRDGERRMLSMHRLVQAVLRDEMGESTQRLWAERIVRAVAQLYPYSDMITWFLCERLLPQAFVCRIHIERWSIAIPEAAELLKYAGKYLHDLAQYALAESFFQRALSIYEQLLEPGHVDILQGLNHLATVYRTRGKYEEAEQLLQRALALEQHGQGGDTSANALTLTNLALLYNDRGAYEQAEPLYRQALAAYERLLEPDHPEIALLQNNLAVLYADQERYDEAEPLYQHALAIREKLLGADHPDTAQSLNNLANLYRAQKKDELAETLHRRALAIRERNLGDAHPDTAHSLSNLGVLLLDQGKDAEAEPLIREALRIREQVLGPGHLDTAISFSILAGIYLSQGENEQAERYCRQALSTFEKVLKPDHPTAAGCQKMLALLYQAQGKAEELEALYTHTLAVREDILGPHHPGTATSLNALAILYISQRRYEEAEPLLQRALAIRTQELGYEHFSTIQSLHNLAFFYENMDRHEEARSLFQHVPVTAQGFHALASLYEELGRHEEAAVIRATGEYAARSDPPAQ